LGLVGLFAVPTAACGYTKTFAIAGQGRHFLARLAPRFVSWSPLHGSSNRWQIVEEAFFDILDPG
jgi:hypothetical protein